MSISTLAPTPTVKYGRDSEVVHRLRPEPMTGREQAAQAAVADLDFEIFQHKMQMIALEGKETTMKLGASTAMRWGNVAFGIYTAQGDLAVCATGIYHHAVLSQLPVKYLVKHLKDDPSVGIRNGDSFFYNDPYYGGVHNADMGLCVPVVVDGELVCFIGAAVHTGEAGGSEPGGMVNGAKSRYDEGLLVPPIKIGENFTLKEDLLAMLATMTRDPRTMILDLKARLAAARIAERRVRDFIAEKGAAFFVGALREVLAVTLLGLVTPASFALRAQRHMHEFGTRPEQLAAIAVKNRAHAAHNPIAMFRQPVTQAEVLASPMIATPLTRLQCCPIADGAAALVLVGERLARRLGATVRVAASVLTTGTYGTAPDLARWETDRRAAGLAYEQAGLGPADLNVVECHDAFTIAELLHYEGLGLCPPGAGGAYVESGAAALGGRTPVNPSGGLLSRGHPVGATGVAQVVEIAHHLQARADGRQVAGARVGLAHCMGGDKDGDTKSCTITILQT